MVQERNGQTAVSTQAVTSVTRADVIGGDTKGRECRQAFTGEFLDNGTVTAAVLP
jgi:hypothetical protein